MKEEITDDVFGKNEEEYHKAMQEMECWLTLEHLRKCKNCAIVYRQLYRSEERKFIGIWTQGMMDIPSEVRELVEKDFDRQATERDDWLYTVTIQGKKYFVADNGTFGYTAMLPEEYLRGDKPLSF